MPIEIDPDIENVVITAYKNPTTFGETIEMSLEETLEMTNTDGFLILKDGKIVYEKYFEKMKPTSRHQLYSCTKSFAGLSMAILMEKDYVDENAFVTDLVDAFKNTEGLQDLTVRNLLDMTTNIKFDEYSSSGCTFTTFANETRNTLDADPDRAGINLPVPEGCEMLAYTASAYSGVFQPEVYAWMSNYSYTRWPGPQSIRDYVAGLKKNSGETIGDTFRYRTITTETLGVLFEQVTQDKFSMSSVEWFSENIWSKIGAQADGMILGDAARQPAWGGGGHVSLRDMAKFGEMLLNYGKNSKGEQVVSREIIEDLLTGTPESPAQMARTPRHRVERAYLGKFKADGYIVKQDYLDLIGESDGAEFFYRNKFWNVKDHVLGMNGIHGQHVWIDFDANVVMAKHSSNPTALDNDANDKAMFFDLSTYFQMNAMASKSPKSPKKGPKKGDKKTSKDTKT
jgi:CubicO group peptidase (beta-lactamase class C family)